MADFVSSRDNHHHHPIVFSADDNSSEDDVCSICLEPFGAQDPPTVTSCKHNYHLQCILEWSQRSQECPICARFLSLKDPASQELLAAVENERTSRSRLKIHHIYDDHETDRDARYVDGSYFDEHAMRNFAPAARRVRYINRRRRSAGVGTSLVVPSVPNIDVSDLQQMYSSSEEFQDSGYGSSEADSPTSSRPSTIIDRIPVYVVPSVISSRITTVANRNAPVKPRVPHGQPTSDSSRRPSSSDLLTFPDSIKSRLSAASARYKESFSKSTRGFKEKLLARNNSVKEMGKGVQREMSAGIAGVAKMIEQRLDLASKKTGASAPLSTSDDGTSKFSYKGKGVHESVISLPVHGNNGESTHGMSSHAPS